MFFFNCYLSAFRPKQPATLYCVWVLAIPKLLQTFIFFLDFLEKPAHSRLKKIPEAREPLDPFRRKPSGDQVKPQMEPGIRNPFREKNKPSKEEIHPGYISLMGIARERGLEVRG